MSNTQSSATVRSPASRGSFHRQVRLHDVLQGLFFALAFSFTIALVIGIVH